MAGWRSEKERLFARVNMDSSGRKGWETGGQGEVGGALWSELEVGGRRE